MKRKFKQAPHYRTSKKGKRFKAGRGSKKNIHTTKSHRRGGLIKKINLDNSVSKDFMEELNKKVEELIKTAAARAESNGRKTIMSKDL